MSVTDWELDTFGRIDGYLTGLKTVLTTGLTALFKAHPEPDMRDLWVSIEYPAKEANYPGVWVDVDPTPSLSKVDINAAEHAIVETDEGNIDVYYELWQFTGIALFTIVALTSLERDRIFDQFVKAVAFGHHSERANTFRANCESNPYVPFHMQWDKLGVKGLDATPNTPWGTSDTVYEVTVSCDLRGEFAVRVDTGDLARLSRIDVIPVPSDELHPGNLPAGDGWR